MQPPPFSPLPAEPVLGPDQLQALAEAHRRGVKLRRAISVATFDGWATAIFAAFTLLFAFSSIVGWVMGIGMAAIAYIEFKGAADLRQFKPEAARRLGYNQLALGGLLICYALWAIFSTMIGKNPLMGDNSDPQVAKMLGDYEGLARMISLAVYGSLIAVAILAQGGTAWFYFSREKYVREYVQQTPSWVQQVQKAGGGGDYSR